MWRLALRQIQSDWPRTALTSLVLAAVIASILVLEGFRQGLYDQIYRAVIDRDADLIVTQAGVRNMMAARSSLRQMARVEIEALPGVAAAYPITGLWMIYQQGSSRTPVFLLVYDNQGGPPVPVGKDSVPLSGRDIIIDYSLARKYGLAVGDEMELAEFSFNIAGISRNTAAMFSPFVFINYDSLIDFYLESDAVADFSTFPLLSFLLVKTGKDASREIVAGNIEASIADVDVFTPETLGRSDVDLGHELFGAMFGLLISVAYIIGALVVGLIMYADVSARLRCFGILKALGFEQSALARSVFIQTVLISIIAIPVGVLLGSAMAQYIHWLIPLYQVNATELQVVWHTALACFVFALLGAVVPVRLIAHVDPLVVFRS